MDIVKAVSKPTDIIDWFYPVERLVSTHQPLISER